MKRIILAVVLLCLTGSAVSACGIGYGNSFRSNFGYGASYYTPSVAVVPSYTVPLGAVQPLYVQPAVTLVPAVAVQPAYVQPAYVQPAYVAPAVVAAPAVAVAAALPVVPLVQLSYLATLTPYQQYSFFQTNYGYNFANRLFDHHYGVRGISRALAARISPPARTTEARTIRRGR